MTVTIFSVLTAAIFIINIFLAAALVFLERRDASSTWAWLLVLFFIPIAGFFVYLLLGRKLRKKKLFKWEGRERIGIENLIAHQMNEIHDGTFSFRDISTKDYSNLIYLHLRNNGALLTQNNHVKIYNDGRKKFDALIRDIEQAQDHIHIQYYIFRLDQLGNRIWIRRHALGWPLAVSQENRLSYCIGSPVCARRLFIFFRTSQLKWNFLCGVHSLFGGIASLIEPPGK